MANYCGKCGTALFDGQYTCPICEQRKHNREMERIRNSGRTSSSGGSSSGPCFVATVAFGDPHCEELNILRKFRDEKLKKHLLGQSFIRWYYSNGEQIANWVNDRRFIKGVVKWCLEKVVNVLRSNP